MRPHVFEKGCLKFFDRIMFAIDVGTTFIHALELLQGDGHRADEKKKMGSIEMSKWDYFVVLRTGW